MKKQFAWLVLLLFVATTAEATDIGRYRKLKSCVLAERLDSISDLEKKGWSMTGNPTIDKTVDGSVINFDANDIGTSLVSIEIPASGTIIAEIRVDTIASWVATCAFGRTDYFFSINVFGGTNVPYARTVYGGAQSSAGQGPSGYAFSTTDFLEVAVTWTAAGQVITYSNGVVGVTENGVNIPTGYGHVSIGSAIDGGDPADVTVNKYMIFNRVLSAQEISDIYNDTTFDYDLDLVSHWDFSEINPQDLVGSNDGTGTGLVASTDIVGAGGNDRGIEFNGSDEYVSTTAISSEVPFTYLAKAKINGSFGSDQIIIGQWTSTVKVFEMDLSTSDNLRFIMSDGTDDNGTRITSGFDLTNETGVHLVGVGADGTNGYIFYDDNYYTTTLGEDGSSGLSTVEFARMNFGGANRNLDGVIYDVYKYSALLTPLQIEDLFLRDK